MIDETHNNDRYQTYLLLARIGSTPRFTTFHRITYVWTYGEVLLLDAMQGEDFHPYGTACVVCCAINLKVNRET